MSFFQALQSSEESIRVIDSSIALEQYISIDLSVNNVALSEENLQTAEDFERYLNHYLRQNNGMVAYGGYHEIRNLYKRSSIFNNSDAEERNIHMGLDLWFQAGTPVLAALDGSIHSFANNTGLGNYGPTIILQHQLEQFTFYTLYGHLSLESLDHIQIGQNVKKGNQIATLGDHTINGNYAPHLHFQIIKEIGPYNGDYPGVCSKKDLDYYLNNCPNPNLLLKIK